MSRAWLICISMMIGLSSRSVFSQINSFQESPYSAIPSRPANLAEAAGAYLASVDYLNYIKTTGCGYALVRKIPSTDYAVSREVIPHFQESQRAEVGNLIDAMREKMASQSRVLYGELYAYLTKQDKHDHKTACGYIASSAFIIAKQSAENFNKILGY